MDEIRRKRVEEELRDVIASLIIGGQVKDPRVGPLVSVTRVEAARDLSSARVFVSTVGGAAASAGGDGPGDELGPGGPAELDAAVKGLQSAAGFIQAQLGRRMRTRLTPRLIFIGDKGIREGFELNERMKDLLS